MNGQVSPDGRSWTEVLVDFDDHVHGLARDCRHLAGSACRVCCVHADDPRITEPEPSDVDDVVPSEWRDEDLSRARFLVMIIGGTAVALAGATLSALTLAGVIPS